jgi:peptide-methionine (S)-S-oxide reductase
VVRTRVGYSGGTKKSPTYHDLGDQTETIQLDYDPTQISYKELLAIFWESHNPGSRSWSRQYMTAIFFHNDEQKKLAQETKNQVAARIKDEVYTQILPATEFYLAEDYHQKYFLRQEPELLNELTAVYPTTKDFVASTAAARLNGYVAGYGTRADIEEEIGSLGLSPTGNKRLVGLASKSEPTRPTQGCPLPR